MGGVPVSSLAPVIDLVFAPLLTAVLAMARPLGMTLVLPVFTRAQLGAPITAGFALALGLPAMPLARETLAAGSAQLDTLLPPGALWFGAVALKEVVAGALLGLLFGIPIWIVMAAGEFLDLSRNAGMNEAQDPAGGQMSTSAALLSFVAIAIFVAAGGLRLVAEGLYASYAAWPLPVILPELSPGAGSAMLRILDTLMRAGLIVAAPVLLAMLVAEVAAMLVARAVPKMQTYELAATVKNLVFILMLLLGLGFLLDSISRELGGLPRGAAREGFRSLFAP